jgi:hypothetical protein
MPFPSLPEKRKNQQIHDKWVEVWGDGDAKTMNYASRDQHEI